MRKKASDILDGLNDPETTAAKLEITVGTVRQYIQSGKLHAVRLGRAVFVSDDEILRYLGSRNASQRKNLAKRP